MADYSSGNIVYDMSIDAKNLFENADKAKAKLSEMEGYGDKAAKGLDKVDKSAKNTGDSLGKLTSIAKAVSAALLTSKIISYAESWNELEDRIQNTGATANQTKDILNKLITTSNRNGRKVNESAELYIRLSNSMKEMGYSTNDSLNYIDTLSNLMTINKTSTMGAESAINALTKAQMKGKLAGEEANSVFNAMPSILKTLGSELNKTESEIRTMASNGELSMQQFTDAMITAQGETAALADNMRNNVGDGLNRIENNLKQFLGELNNSTGATKLIVDSLILVSEHADVVVNVMGVLAAIYAGRYVTSISAAAIATLRQSASLTMLSTRAGIASLAMKGLSTAMNFLGGPAGILLMAAGAFISWSSSVDEAKKKSLDLTDNIDSLTESFKKMTSAQMDSAIYDLDKKIQKQTITIKEQEAAIESFKKRQSGTASRTGVVLSEDYQGELKNLKAELDTMRQVLDQDNELMSKYVDVQKRATESTAELKESTKAKNNEFSKDTTDNITKNITKLAQETEIAGLKQNKLNKEAYVYQNILSILGDDAEKYQASLLKAAQTGELFKGSIQGLPSEVYPLISALSELYDINNSGSVKTNNAASKIKELKDNIAVARLEVQGAIKDAKELEALQNAKATGGNQNEINQIIALTKEYEKLELAKAGKSFAQEQVNNGLSDLDKIELEEQAKLTKLNEWRETGLASEQLYQDALTAITEDASKQRKKIDDDTAAAQQANMSAILSSASAMFGGMSDLIGGFSNESGTAYKAMFALSKGFAVANAALNLQSAIMQAMADPTALTPAQKFANYAAIASAGGSLLSQISSISFGGGREHGGAVSGDSMYRVGEGGKPEILMAGGRQYMIPGENGKVISNKDIKATSTSGINVVINNYGNDSVETRQSSDNNQIIIDIAAKKGAEMGYQKVTESISNHSGGLWTALTQNTNTKAKL